MKLLRCSVENFGSYPRLELDFSDLGLTLVYGATGSGKSTLLDLACWVLYGQTAKDGAVDEIRSWQTPQEPTRGTLHVQLADGCIAVTRVRGSARENDLFWTEDQSGEAQRRGKDLKDTQRLLESRLGLPGSVFSLAAYFHEFSPSAAFFTASAKDRRSLFERIADTRLPDRLSVRSAEGRKSVKSELSSVEADRQRGVGQLQQLGRSHEGAVKAAAEWEARQLDSIRTLAARWKGFEVEKKSKIEALTLRSSRWEAERSARIDDIIAKIESAQAKVLPPEECQSKADAIQSQSRCSACGSLPKAATEALTKLAEARANNSRVADKVEAQKDQLQSEVDAVNPHAGQLVEAKALENHYSERIEEEKVKANPFKAQIDAMEVSIAESQEALRVVSEKVSALEHRLALLCRLYDLSFNLRGELLRKAVAEIEESTNRLLEIHFDSELRVAFRLDGDDLEVDIQKSGYECVYRQLSKGQRGLLKLCFVVSVMRDAANTAGVHFDQLFFDEALDGLDPDLKVKAFGLFEELSLEHGSILVVEHSSEFKELFARRLRVTMAGDESQLTDESEGNGEGT